MLTQARHEATHPALALRLLAGAGVAYETAGADWGEMLRVALRNRVLVRLSDRLKGLGVQTPPHFDRAAEAERRRAASMFELIRRVSRSCERHGIEHIFAKSFQHYPDMGGDVDLFVAPNAESLDGLILEGLQARPAGRDLWGRMSGVTAYRVDGAGAVLEIQHGRIGILGEHVELVGQFIRRGRRAEVGGVDFLLPSAEDLLVLHGMQRVYRHGFIRLCDVLSTAALVGQSGLDWDYVLRLSRRLGTLYGLKSYLAYVGRIYRETLGSELLPAELSGGLAAKNSGRGEFRGGVFVFPRFRIAGRVYLGKVSAAARAGDWGGVSRLSLMPLVAAATLTRKFSPRAAATP